MFYLTNSYFCVCFTKCILLCSSDEICASLNLSPDQVQPQARIIFQIQWTRFTSMLALVKQRVWVLQSDQLRPFLPIVTTGSTELRVTENTN